MDLTGLPLISIIINNYNYARFLPQAIDSALTQTYSRTEVIVVDDGSTDHTRQVIEAYEDRVMALYKKNGGQPSALNLGFSCCQGEIVIFLDADDRLRPEVAQVVADAFRANPGTVKVQYRMEVIDAQGMPNGFYKPAPGITASSGLIQQETLAFPFDLRWLPTSGNAFSATMLREIMPIPEDEYGQAGADWYLVHMASLFGPVIFIDRVLACYRVHGANSYDVPDSAFNLTHVRQTIRYSCLTGKYLKMTAQKLGLRLPHGDILSVSEIANRVISLKHDPSNHPIRGETRWNLLKLGITASLNRFDVSFAKRCVFILWFIAMALAPKNLSSHLVQFFFDPQSRGFLNHIPGVKIAG